MPDFVIPAPTTPSIPVSGGGAFPVRRVYCIGRNYAAHAIEMGHDPDREAPFFFQKNPNNLDSTGEFPYPPHSSDVHHEVELVVALKSGGSNIPLDQALNHVWGYAVSLDMTRRDLQGEAKKMGRPWEMGKGFDQSAPCTGLKKASVIGHPASGAIWLKVNGEVKQKGDLNQHIWNTPETISYLSHLVELFPGDIIMMDTPAGVGPCFPGDTLQGHVDGFDDLFVTYAK